MQHTKFKIDDKIFAVTLMILIPPLMLQKVTKLLKDSFTRSTSTNTTEPVFI